MPDIEVFTVKEVAVILKTTVRTVRELIKNKKLTAVRVGREYRVSKRELEIFVSQGNQKDV